MSEFAIQVKHLDKMYKLYNKPSDRLKEALGFKVPVREHYALRDVSFEVKRGETLAKIAKKTGYSLTALKQANDLTYSVLTEGQTIALPKLKD